MQNKSRYKRTHTHTHKNPHKGTFTSHSKKKKIPTKEHLLHIQKICIKKHSFHIKKKKKNQPANTTRFPLPTGDGCSCVSTDTLVTAVIGSVVGSILALFLVELLVYVLVKLFQRRRWKKRQRQRELGRSTRGVENMAMDYADSGGNHGMVFGTEKVVRLILD